MQSFNMHINCVLVTTMRYKVCICMCIRYTNSDSFIAITVHSCSTLQYRSGQVSCRQEKYALYSYFRFSVIYRPDFCHTISGGKQMTSAMFTEWFM